MEQDKQTLGAKQSTVVTLDLMLNFSKNGRWGDVIYFPERASFSGI